MKGINRLLNTGIISWLFIILIWQLGSYFSSPDFLPAPLSVIDGLRELIANGNLMESVFVSFRRILLGWFFGSCIGLPIGICIGSFTMFKKFCEPILHFFRFIPSIGFITLFIIWFGIGEEGKIVLIMYATVFIVILNTASGVLNVDTEKVRAAQCLGASKGQILFNVIIPASLPYMYTGLRLAMGNSFAAIVGAEMLAANEGMGYLIWTARLYFKTEWIFVGLIGLGLMGYFTDKLLGTLANLFLNKYGINERK